MAILIPKMEMPSNCGECSFLFADVLHGRFLCRVNKAICDETITSKKEDCPLTALPTIEELMEPMCDQCQWPGWYKDPDDMQREKCSRCPVEAKLMEALYDDD